MNFSKLVTFAFSVIIQGPFVFRRNLFPQFFVSTTILFCMM